MPTDPGKAAIRLARVPFFSENASGMLTGRQILILEDETLLRKSLARYLESAGANAFQAGSLQEARNIRE